MKQTVKFLFQIFLMSPLFLTATFLRANAQTLTQTNAENRSVSVIAENGETTLPLQNLDASLTDEKAKSDLPSALQTANNYARPTAEKRFHRYLSNTAGTYALLGIGIATAYDQVKNRPPEWKKTGTGFARRLASNFGENAVGETVTYGLEEAFKLDGHFYKSDKRDFGSRLSNGLLTTFTGRTPSGKRVFNPSRIVGSYAGSFVAVNAWYPQRFNNKDAFRRGSQALLLSVGFNLLNEFLFKRK